MPSAWDLLKKAGLPLGPAALFSPADLPSDSVLARTLFSMPPDQWSEREAAAVAAWLGAWQSGWPTSFERVFGARGGHLKFQLLTQVDEGRYLKLRRIAHANLGRWL